eukprot:TRINITY_DN9781_c0_g1_i2.p1 TRINITY_DN9781_c0_g1~~TRINITY_DN9781_c0_g1_i2.p1  ORF type:complete len:504 (+),score=75.61 TRINITY_DN9781_c0_g1_i2:53-1564(+)
MDTQSLYHTTRRIAREQYTLSNRFLSIHEDADFVEQFCSLLPQLPTFGNKRCGAWYKRRFDSYTHFKSTDGHAGVWHFSLKRLNLNLLNAITKSNCQAAIVVDATRKARTVPDSFSRTLPIWCAVINTTARQLQLEEQGTTELDEELCEQVLVPPKVISASEQAQMRALVADRVDRFREAGFDLRPLLALRKPLRCLWYNPATTVLDEAYLPELPLADWSVVLCLSASQPVDVEPRQGWLYIQGAADDEEAWSQGLTAQQFWEHHDILVDACKQGEPKLISAIAELRTNCTGQQSAISRPTCVVPDQLYLCYEAPPVPALAISCTLGRAMPPETARFRFQLDTGTYDAVDNGGTPYADSIDLQSAMETKTRILLEHAIPAGKKHRHELEVALAPLLAVVRQALTSERAVCIMNDEEGSETFDRSGIVMLAIMLTYYDLQDHRLMPLLNDDGSCKTWPGCDKSSIQRALQFLISKNEHVVPTRHNMKKLSCFFLSSDPPETLWL